MYTIIQSTHLSWSSDTNTVNEIDYASKGNKGLQKAPVENCTLWKNGDYDEIVQEIKQ